VLTVSDTRTEADDKSGKILLENLTKAKYFLVEKMLFPITFIKDLETMGRSQRNLLRDRSVSF
jgi:molybdopterin biosynthesis enzyme MoaB